MKNFQELLAHANKDDYESICYLIENAGIYYDDIVAALEANLRRIPLGLKVVLGHISAENFKEKLIELTTSRTPHVSRMAYKALGNYSDNLVLSFLKEKLVSDQIPARFRNSAVTTLGNIQNPQAKEILLTYAKDQLGQPLDFDSIDKKILESEQIDNFDKIGDHVDLVKALCKHGDQSFSGLIPYLLNHPIGKGDNYEYEKVQRQCVSQLESIFIENLVPTILETLEKNYQNWKLSAILGLQYLGSKDVIEELIKLLAFSNKNVATSALFTLKQIVGAYPYDVSDIEKINIDEVKTWWSGIEKNYEANTVYRNGVSRNLPQLADLFLDEMDHPTSVLEEINITYGIDLKPISRTKLFDQTYLLKKVEKLRENSDFVPGKLYKFGYLIS